jgi:DNA polymerase III epsilon subunit-like protein
MCKNSQTYLQHCLYFDFLACVLLWLKKIGERLFDLPSYMILDLLTLLSAANDCVLFWGLLANAPSTTLVAPSSAVVHGQPLLSLSAILELLSKFGNNVMCDVLAMFPVEVHCNLVTAS